jgi:hypothetical protein
MHQRSTHQEQLSIPTWETLHTWLRGRMQELVQWALEAEVTELWGGCGTSAGGRWTGCRGTGTGTGSLAS